MTVETGLLAGGHRNTSPEQMLFLSFPAVTLSMWVIVPTDQE